jgi:hypothetical protein
MASRQEYLKYGFIAAGAMALGGAGIAGAGNLIDSGDVKDGSLKLKDLANPTVDQLSESRSVLVSDVFFSAGIIAEATPGTDGGVSFLGEGMPVPPPGKTSARGLAVWAHNSKSETPIADLVVTVMKNGEPTPLTCTTDADGECKDTGNVLAPVGSRLTVSSIQQKVSGQAQISLALEHR